MNIEIDDIKIEMKKYDRKKNLVISNLVLNDLFELRGYRVRFTKTKFSSGNSVWVVSPPAIKTPKGYFHIVRCLNTNFWSELEKRIVAAAIEFTNNPK